MPPKRKASTLEPAQQRLGFAPVRPPLATMSPNLPAPASLPAAPAAPAATTTTTLPPAPAAPAAAPVAQVGNMLTELRRVSARIARDTIAQLRAGYRAQSGAVVPAASTHAMGCILAQKVANRSENGYVQIPEGFAAFVGKKALPHNAHRLLVVAEKPAAEVHRLLFEGHHASHLCHHPVCINPDHIVVEGKAANEDRKQCNGRVLVKTQDWGGGTNCHPKPAHANT